MSEEAKVEVPEVKEFRFEYQPRDEEGRPLGNVQVVVAANPEEALQKMAEQNQHLIRLSRKLKRDLRLGVSTTENIPENAPRFRHEQYDFNPAPLSAEERLEIVRDINDPETFDKAAARIVRSQIGDPEQIRTTLSQAQQDIAALRAEKEADAFRRATPDYYVCQENFLTLANWMVKNNLDPVQENFTLAYNTLKEAGLMVERPKPEAPKVEPPKEAPKVDPPKTEPEPRPDPRPVSSGLTRSNSSEQGPAPKTGYSAAEIDKMSAEEYKAKVLIPQFKTNRQ